MKCFCCQDGNLTNFACNECQNIICFKCINELKKAGLLGENILGTGFSFDIYICIGQI